VKPPKGSHQKKKKTGEGKRKNEARGKKKFDCASGGEKKGRPRRRGRGVATKAKGRRDGPSLICGLGGEGGPGQKGGEGEEYLFLLGRPALCSIANIQKGRKGEGGGDLLGQSRGEKKPRFCLAKKIGWDEEKKRRKMLTKGEKGGEKSRFLILAQGRGSQKDMKKEKEKKNPERHVSLERGKCRHLVSVRQSDRRKERKKKKGERAFCLGGKGILSVNGGTNRKKGGKEKGREGHMPFFHVSCREKKGRDYLFSGGGREKKGKKLPPREKKNPFWSGEKQRRTEEWGADLPAVCGKRKRKSVAGKWLAYAGRKKKKKKKDHLNRKGGGEHVTYVEKNRKKEVWY